MTAKEHLHQLIDELPESEVPAARRFLQFLSMQEPPVDPAMLARIDEQRRNPSPGIPHEEILRESRRGILTEANA